MALSDRWTRSQYRTFVRTELMDSAGDWWTDTELNNYLADWQDQLQDALEFTWGSSTYAVSSATETVTLTDIDTDILRPGYVTFNNKTLTPMSEQELDVYRRDWRNVVDVLPVAWYQNQMSEMVLWPTPTTSGTLGVEYPLKMTFTADTSTSELPPWTRYSSKDYVCYRAYLRHGPNHSLNKAAVYKKRYNLDVKYFEEWKKQHLPERYGMMRPGTAFERKLVDPVRRGLNVAVPDLTFSAPADEVPSGTVNGVNDTFTLTQTPSPAASLKLFVDGVLMQSTTNYTLSAGTITFVTAFIPITGQSIFASYRYAGTN